MNLTLKLAHDDAEQNKVSALRILNELAPDMGQTLCECYIVPEIRSLGLDESSLVRMTVAKNLLNISTIVSLDYFNMQVFPLYSNLTQDKEEKVRKTCAEVVADIANVSPLEKKGQALADIYYRFLKDPSSKIVRGTAFQNIGPFIAALKEMKDIDQRIIDFYVSTTDSSSNKDVCYYSSYNFPAFIYTLGREHWEEFRKIYVKLAKFNDVRIKKTLSHSIHELAHILGTEITEADLVPVMERFLKDGVNEIRVGALKNLHIFLAEVLPENRHHFIKYLQYKEG
jgi:serine/threonine-protein phosphatase 4 regulatory subunit 1